MFLGLLFAAGSLLQDGPPPLSTTDLPEIRLGDSKGFDLKAGPEGESFRLDVQLVDPLTIIAESFDADVLVRVEEASGKILAEDDDSGTETDSWLQWTPTTTGRFVIRAIAKEPSAGTGRLVVLKGTLSPEPADPLGAARAYWDRAGDRAHARRDAARADLALARLATLEGLADPSGARESRREREESLAQVRDLLKRAQVDRAEGRIESARERVRGAMGRLVALSAGRLDALIAIASLEVAQEADSVGDLPTALEAKRLHRDFCERTRPGSHPDLQETRLKLSVTHRATGDLPAARALQETVLSIREKTLPDEHADLQIVRGSLAATIAEMGDLRSSRALDEKVLAIREKTLPDEHPALQTTRMNLAVTLHEMGDLRGAKELTEKVLSVFERTLSEEHPSLQAVRGNLASTMKMLGDVRGALALEEKILAVRERTLPEDHPHLQLARLNLGSTLTLMGDLFRARALFEKALAVWEKTHPDDHPDLQRARLNLAVTKFDMGDLLGARALDEKVLAIRERTLPEGHSDLQAARVNLAGVMWAAGELAGARALYEKVLATSETSLPEESRELQATRSSLATTLMDLGDLRGALELEKKVLAVWERSLPEEDPDLRKARLSFAWTMFQLGDVAGARAAFEKILAIGERTLGEEHPDLRRIRRNLCWTLAAQGDFAGLGTHLLAVAESCQRWLWSSRSLSPREAAEAAEDVTKDLATVLSLASLTPVDRTLSPRLFALVESRRRASTWSDGGLSRVDDAQAVLLRARSLEARQRLAGLVAGLRAGSSAAPPRTLAEAVEERDRCERAFRDRLAALGVPLVEIDVESVGKALPERSAAVAYYRYKRYGVDPEKRHLTIATDWIFAHVIRPDATLERVEIARGEDVARAVEAWRAAVGEPFRARGATPLVESGREEEEDAAAHALRSLVLDPVLAAAGGATTLHVCLDDVLHLVPWDSLPLGDGLVGHRYEIHVETSLERLIRGKDEASPPGPPSLLAVGGVDFESAEAEPPEAPLTAATSAPKAYGRDASVGPRFGALPGAEREVRSIAEKFAEAFGFSARMLEGKASTKSAFIQEARGARFIHVATHGYFASEELRSWQDEPAERSGWKSLSVEKTVTGLSPMTLCGLALSGANRGADPLGRVPGILTAEELAGVDLSRCALAVLSACETNVGIRRAGQGIASLQAALHAAGVKTAITSLWKVDDERTRELMVDFYRRLWVEKKPKAQSLWEAKCALRATGAPTRDWAGWVMTGDPGGTPVGSGNSGR